MVKAKGKPVPHTKHNAATKGQMNLFPLTMLQAKPQPPGQPPPKTLPAQAVGNVPPTLPQNSARSRQPAPVTSVAPQVMKTDKKDFGGKTVIKGY